MHLRLQREQFSLRNAINSMKCTFYSHFIVRISLHELTGNQSNEMNQLVTKTKLNAKDSNVIVVDYSSLVDFDHYVDAGVITPTVADAVSDLIALLKSNFNLDLKQLHLVGYSLGGQIAGLTGQLISKKFQQKIQYITALDPIGLIFTPDMDADKRLSADDAEYVEVVHTNTGGRGFSDVCGDVDYYPNGGDKQPGCDSEDDECSHRRAYELIPDMWKPEPGYELILTKCASLEEMDDGSCRWLNKKMGDLHNLPSPGIYYLQTNAKRPFGQGPKKQFW